jgi:conjugative relaxase-like TrwC/TraI family protein
VSVFWALSDEHTRARVEQAVIKSTREALRYLENEALYTRRGKGGCIIEKGSGMISALFLHGTSREQDPQIHVHCPTANLVHRTDGTWGTMLGITSKDRHKDFRKTRLPFYRQKMAAGALFRASLAAWLEKDLGLPIRRQGTSFEIDGIPKALLDRLSTRSHQIQEELAATGATDAKSAKRAALVTRRRKTQVPREELFRKWRAQAAGFDLSAVKRVSAHRDQAKESEDALAGAQAKLQSAQRPPSKPQFVRRLAEEAQGRGLDAGAVVAVIERIFRQPPRRPSDRDADRAVKLATTILKRSARNRKHALGIANVLLAVKQTEFLRGRRFSPDERKALARITRTRGSIQVLPTGPETSNTDVLKTARLAWERAGFKVLLASPSSGAKEFWEEQTGVHSISLR